MPTPLFITITNAMVFQQTKHHQAACDGNQMNVFKLRDDLISEYNAYISSFVYIQDERIQNYVHQEVEEGLLWPTPLIQLNPSYEKGASIDELIDEGILEPGCGKFSLV